MVLMTVPPMLSVLMQNLSILVNAKTAGVVLAQKLTHVLTIREAVQLLRRLVT